MAHRRSLRWIGRGIAATALGAMLMSTLPAQAAPWSNRQEFANERFRGVWNETDANPGDRSLTWGPAPWWDYYEFYKQSPNGLRQVQYFDKARMEINDPAAAQDRFFVTNGLLPVEMISGRVKLGNGEGDDENEQRTSAQIPVAGDLAKVNPDAPTYASFRNVATTANNNRADQRIGEMVSFTLDKNGNIGLRPELATAETRIAIYNSQTGHNVPQVFKSYMDYYDRAGGVGSVFAFGYPVTEPYWIRARVGGVEKDIMVQIFERRVLTFTPSNPEQYKVEMGNVGQHYFQWRYPNQGTPWDAAQPYLPVAYASHAKTPGHPEVFTTDVTGAGQNNITIGGASSAPFSMLRSWDRTQVRIIGDSRRDRVSPTPKRQLYSFTINGSEQKRLLVSEFDDYNGAVSPDGTKVAFVSDRDGNAELFLLHMVGGAVSQLTSTAAPCVNEYPTWEPDGSGLAWHTNCSGNFEIYRADLRYAQDKGTDLQASLVRPINLSNHAGDDRFPRISPSGMHVVFRSDRHGNGEIHVMRTRDGSAERRITNSARADEARPTWTPSGTEIIFDSDADGDRELYVRDFDGTRERRLTDNTVDDYEAIFAQ